MMGWVIGDWLATAEKRWGDMVAEASELTGLQPGRLADLKWVAKSIPFSCRKEELSFSHHHEVAKFDAEEQALWLCAAETNAWSVRELREAIALAKAPVPGCSVGWGGFS